MITIVIYDIVTTKIRNRIIRFCKDYGLYRVQKSVFLGKLNPEYYQEFSEKIISIINQLEDSVYIIPISKHSYNKAKFIGQTFDSNIIKDSGITVFF